MSGVSVDGGVSRRQALGLMGGAFVASSALGGVAGRAWAAEKPELARVALGQAKAAGQSAQLPLAIANKLFEGLDASMSYFNSGAEMNEALASGGLHIIATGDVPAIGLLAHRGPAKCIAALSDFSADQGIVFGRGSPAPSSSRAPSWG
jgi:ABC-type nitrate/sulfonate/bicarbonate transport system substrate-binding protein